MNSHWRQFEALFLRTDAYVVADVTSICSDIFFLVGNANVCPLGPDRNLSNIGFSGRSSDGGSGDFVSVFTWQ